MEDNPDDALQSGVQIQEAPVQQENADENETANSNANSDAELSLGDRILIESKRFGRTLGRVYYIDDSLVQVLPDGVSHRVESFPITDGEFAPELGVTSIEFEEGPRTGFVGLTGLRAKSTIDTFTEDGQPIGIFKILEVNEQQDSAIVADITGAELLLTFGGRGIPRDAPFQVLRLSPEEEVEEKDTEETEEEAAAEEDEDDEIIDIGTLVIPIATTIIEVAAKDQTFPDSSQKSDMTADLLSYFSDASRKNPNLKKRIRALTEMLYQLKTDMTQVNDDGTIRGEKKLSLDSLSELLTNKTVPLSRPVLQTKRVLQVDELAESGGSERHTEELDIYILDSTLKQIQQYIDTYGGLQAGQDEASEASLPLFYQFLSGFFQRYPLGDVYQGDDYSFQTDSEYLRHDVEEIPGLPELVGRDRDEVATDSDVGTVELSLRRGLGPTIRKQGPSGQRIVIRADKANVKFYLLFPEKVANALGSTRTGNLFTDVMRSHDELKSLKAILDEVGEPTEEPDANNILILKSGESTIANISWTDYIQAILKAMTPRGIGDIKTLLQDYGVINKELTPQQQEVVHERVKEVLLLIRGLIRRIISEMQTEEPTHESMQGAEFANFILETAKEHPMLLEILTEAKQRSPGWSQTDLGLLAALYTYAQDYAIVALGKEPIGVQRERIRLTRRKFIQSLLNAQKIRMNTLNAGQDPEVNPCPHVKALNQIRRVKDDTERLGLMNAFIRNYEGSVNVDEPNWIQCRHCKLKLVCKHELLQVQQYLHPREFDALQKEIILNFTGGAFGAKHVCKVCGIPISDIEYDRNIEFDDEGRPLNGRGEIVDKTAMELEEIEQKLGAPVGTEGEIEWETEEKTTIYNTVRQICDRIGVFPDAKGYRDIVNRVNVELLRQDRKSFMEIQKRKKEKGEKTSDYDVYINRLLVSFAAACLLIEIQSKMPDYTLRYAVPGCRAGFDGFPLYSSADPKSPTESTGIHYIACALNGIVSDKAPWVLTGWQQERSDSKRQLLISTGIINVLKVISQEPATQIALEKKREYMKEIFGKESETGLPSEKLPYRFSPPIETSLQASKASSAEPTVPEAANSKGNPILALNWIRAANQIASQHARVIPNSPYTETGCCFSSVLEPGKFWQEKRTELPLLPNKEKTSFALGRQTWFFTPIEARPLSQIDAETPIDLAYKIFSRICWRGSRKGLPHELGFDGKCDWCETEIPIEVLFPDVDEYGEPTAGDDALRDAFMAQGIRIDKASFEDLLQASHTVNSFESYRPPLPQDSGTVMMKVGEIAPQPVEDWQMRIARTLQRLSTARANAERAEIADALQDVAESVAEAEDTIRRRIGEDAFSVLSSIFQESTATVFETVKSYLVLPIQRIITRYDTDHLRVHKQYQLSSNHQQDVQDILKLHTKISASVNRDTLGEFGVAKYKFFIEQMSAIMKQTSELRSMRISFGAYLLPYVTRALVMGPLADLLNPNKIPSEATEIAGLAAGKSMKSILVTVRALIQQFVKERLAYSPEVVKEKIAKADEKEREGFIADQDKLSDEDRKLEQIRKKLGMGRWAIGGSKLIYSYDADFYDKRREDRLQMYQEGGNGPEGPAAPEGRQADQYGVFSFGEAYNERDGGYDFVFYDAADAE